ncbi:DNA cytosine methyltransferase [Streptomyces sp. WAC 06725]|uniref:DNA cytosine methyltransferase n=1 Tax=Streptomyces sp. WAC 06725 TaxID=2203209 RepID=UPI000F749000|nr:DNA cytosine methyltransferase [Streptomyces sp. WAC 06725]RSO40153.1 DNA cytosine methyltransferase [Streptomyces sp. WAC 06725]
MPRIGSFCTGYGGLDMAAMRVFGGELAWVSDIDPGARQILAHHHPDVPNIGDLRVAGYDQVPPIDIALGGYPCQPFSTAGHRKGTADARHIWPDIARALRVLRPRIAIFENVANHLRLGFDTVLVDLAHLGFDAEWCVVRADEVGAPHQRRRLIVLAVAADAADLGHQWGRSARGRGPGPADRGVAAADPDRGGRRAEQSDVSEGKSDSARFSDEPACPTCGCDESDHDAGGFCASCHGCTDPELGRPNEAAAHTDRGGLTGHGELPAGRDAVRQRVRHDADRRRSAAPADAASVGRGQGRPEPARQQRGLGPACGGAPDWGAYAPAVARWEQVTGRRAPWATDDQLRLNPQFVEWMMGLRWGHVTHVPGLSRNQQLKALGNGVVPQQAEAGIRLLLARAQATRAAA